VSPDVLASHDSFGVDSSHDISEVVELGIQDFEILGLEDVLFGPMGSTVVSSDDGSEFVVEFSVWDRKSVWSGLSAQCLKQEGDRLPVADNSDPCSLSSVTWAQVDVVCARPSNLEREMGPQTLGIRCLTIQPFSKLLKACLGIGRVDSPFESILRVLLVS
jgi:hypothetical protein